jgi:hypothetical protein
VAGFGEIRKVYRSLVWKRKPVIGRGMALIMLLG